MAAASIITGGGKGIGRSIALKLAETTHVIVVGRTLDSIESVCEKINSSEYLHSARFILGDVTNQEIAASAVRLAKSSNWEIQNLVISAGIGGGGYSIAEFDEMRWQEVIDVNLNGAFYFIKACLPQMIKNKGGNICLLSSIAGVRGYAYQSAYTASKHAMVGLAKSVALEYGKYGIVAVPICPGFVDTEMTTRTVAGLMKRRGITEKEARECVARVSPQRRIMPPEEVAEMVAFICSGKVPSLNGNPVILSGGE